MNIKMLIIVKTMICLKGNQFSKVQNSNNQNDNKHDINEFVSKEGYSKLLQQRIIKMEMTLIIRLL